MKENATISFIFFCFAASYQAVSVLHQAVSASYQAVSVFHQAVSASYQAVAVLHQAVRKLSGGHKPCYVRNKKIAPVIGCDEESILENTLEFVPDDDRCGIQDE